MWYAVRTRLQRLSAGGWGSPGVRRWGKEISRFFSVQLVITGLNLAIGLLIVRFLSKSEYGLYTVGFTVMSTFTNITNIGVTPTLTSLAGKYYDSKERMGAIVVSALGFRRSTGLYLAVPVVLYGLYQYRLLEVSYGLSILFLLTFGLGGYILLDTTIFRIPLWFNNRNIRLQNFELVSVVVKLAAVLLIGFLLPSALGFAVVSIGTLVIVWRLTSREVAEVVDLTAPPDPSVRAKIWELAKPTAVTGVYLALQDQITVFICSIYGTAETVGEVGALGKLAQAFALLTIFVNSYILPRVSKATTVRGIVKWSSSVIALFGAASAVMLLVAHFYPELLLWVLGSQYGNLDSVLVLAVAVSMATLLTTQGMALCVTRGWVKWLGLYAPIAVALQITLLLTMDITDLRGILVFNGTVALTCLCFVFGVYAFELRRFSQREPDVG